MIVRKDDHALSEGPILLGNVVRTREEFLLDLASCSLEILHRALVLLRSSPRSKRSQILSLSRLRIFLAGIQTILAGW